MLLARGTLLGAMALRRLPASAPPTVSALSLARSFSTSHVARLPPTFFQSHRPNFGDAKRGAGSAGTGAGARANSGSSTSGPKDKPQSRRGWAYSRYGFVSPTFTQNHPWLAVLVRLTLSVIVGTTIITGVILCHDAFTYSRRHVDRVNVNPLALNPRRGGPKNLPIIDYELDDLESEEKQACEKRPRLVIIGGGWGSVSLLKTLPPKAYNVTLVSPENYFCFTPLLPSACVGTVEPRTLVEPLRRLVARVHGHYLAGSAVDISMGERLLEVEVPNLEGTGMTRAYLPYDKLVIAVGSRSNDHGVKGLQYCYQLKTIPDAQAIRRKIMNNLETAALPTTTPEERKHLLSFVVCGGGPTGVEFAAELSDMLNEDVLDYYPKMLKDHISVTIVQSRDHILNTYAEKISKYAEEHFAREAINVVTNARVTEVTPTAVHLSIKHPDGTITPKILDASMVLWSTGIAMQPFTRRMVELLPNQFHSKAVQVDSYLRVEGAPKGTVYAIGDAATIHLNLLSDLLLLWERFDENRDDKISFDEYKLMSDYIKKKYPLTTDHLEKLHDVFAEFDKDSDHHLTLNEVADMFISLSKKATTLPATAQVASQEGEYLGHMFGKLARQSKVLKANDVEFFDEVYYHPFKYRNLGTLAYIGNSAAFDINGWSSAGNLVAMYAWRSVYWGMQVSMRQRFMLMLDWIKRGIFGRDLSKF